MTKITDPWLTQDATQHLFSIFEESGFQLLCVGGCVRNALLGVPVADIDMSTDALPTDVLALAEQHGLRAIPTGIDHGTVTLICSGVPFEVTTFRDDISTDGRHAVVAFSKSADEDAKRRDFTMNALYCGSDGTVIDYVGGLADLGNRHVRFIGAPAARITEDYLRILRFFRFHAWYGATEGGIDSEGLAACAEHADGLDRLSPERIGSEMIKLLSAPDPAPAIASMGQSGVLQRVMPGADASGLAILVHVEGNAPPDWRRRVLALGGEAIADAWRLSKSDARAIDQGQKDLLSDMSMTELAYRQGKDHARTIALVQAAQRQQQPSVDLEAQLARGADLRFPISAADLMPAFEGPALGERLRQLETAWIASDFALTKADLLRL